VEHIAANAGLAGPLAHTALRSLANRSLVTDNAEGTHYALVPLVADFLRNSRPEVVKETGDRLEKRAYALIIENGYKNHDRFPTLEAAWPGIAPALPLFLSGDNKRLQTVCAALRRISMMRRSGRRRMRCCGRWWDGGAGIGVSGDLRAGKFLAFAGRGRPESRTPQDGSLHSPR
jgi:hypothetical protein